MLYVGVRNLNTARKGTDRVEELDRLRTRVAELEGENQRLRQAVQADGANIADAEKDTLIAGALEPLFSWLLKDGITFWNQAAEELYGYSAAEAIGRRSHDLLQTRHPIPLADLERILLEEGWWEGELVHTTKNGRQIVVDSRHRLICTSEGEPLVVEGNRDITKRKRAEDEILALNATLERRVEERTAKLEEANRELEAFAYTASHDLRAPLRTLEGFSQAVLEDYGQQIDEPGRKYLERISAAAQRMDLLIQDLLSYSQLTQIELRLERVDLNTTVRRVLRNLEHAIAESNAVVAVEEQLPVVQGHASAVFQVIANLVENAVKFVPRDREPSVRIQAERRAPWVRFWVIDNGIGIEPPHRQEIFRVFHRLHGLEAYPGTGIGLAIVRKGIERLGGQVGVESELVKGSRFWFELREAHRNEHD